MTGLAFALVLSAAFVHATWNYLAKRAGGGAAFVWLFAVVSGVAYLPFAIAIVVIQQPRLGAAELGFCAVSAALHLAYFLLLQKGYATGDLSVVYPTARATGPTLSTLAAIVLFAERPSAWVLAGGALIVAGVFFLTWSPAAAVRERVSRSLLFGLLAGSLIGSYTLWDTYAVSVLLIPPLLLDYFSTLGRIVLLGPYALRRRAALAEVWRDHRTAVIGVALLNPLSYILVLTALTFTPVSYVAPAREISVLIGVYMGARLLGEGDTGRRMLCALVIVAGIVLLASN